jgi:hypothetical protein
MFISTANLKIAFIRKTYPEIKDRFSYLVLSSHLIYLFQKKIIDEIGIKNIYS